MLKHTGHNKNDVIDEGSINDVDGIAPTGVVQFTNGIPPHNTSFCVLTHPMHFIKAEVLPSAQPSAPATRAPQNDAAEIEQTQKVGTRIAIAVLSPAYQFNNAYYAVTHTMKYCYSLQKKNSSFLELCSTQLTRTARTRSSLSMFWSQF